MGKNKEYERDALKAIYALAFTAEEEEEVEYEVLVQFIALLATRGLTGDDPKTISYEQFKEYIE